MSKIVVFGGDGFIGRHLVQRLAKANKKDEIYAFDRFSSIQARGDHPFTKYPNVNVVVGNFFNRDEVNDVLQGAKYVFHLISSTSPAASIHDPLIDIDTNIRSSVELFQLCVEQKVKKVIFFSSGGSIYGDVDSSSISEEVVPAPQSPYAIGKLTIEHYLRYFKQVYNLESITYRVSNPYGPGQNIYGKQGVIPIFMNKYLTKEPLIVFGDGTMMRDYIYIDDLIDMITKTYSKPNVHEVYNLGSGKGVTINELIDSIENHTGFSIKKTTKEIPATYLQKSVLDISRFVEEFGVQPTTGLKDGIARTWNYVKEIR